MRNAVFAFLLGVGAISAFLLWRNQAGPRLQVSPQVADFGLVDPGSMAEFDFELSNVGRRKLVISGLKRSCSCTESRLGSTVLGPGESTTLTVSVFGRDELESEAVVVVFSNDDTAPRTLIPLVWHRKELFRLKPVRFDFGLVERSELPKEHVVRLDLVDEDLRSRVTGLTIVPEGLTNIRCDVCPVESDSFQINVVMCQDSPSGELVGQLKVCDQHNDLLCRVPIYAYVPSRLFFRADPVYVAITDEGTFSPVSIHLRSRENADEIDSCCVVVDKTYGEYLSAVVEEVARSGISLLLQCKDTIPNSATNAVVKLNITVRTTGGRTETVRIPANLSLQPGRGKVISAP